MISIVEIYSDTDELVGAAGDRLITSITSAIAARGQAYTC